MKVAVPVTGGHLSSHFGHCEALALVSVDLEAGRIVGTEMLPSPPHQPGLLPAWLHERGATVVIAGGMGHRAQDLFARSGIDVIVGAPRMKPTELVTSYLEGSLETGENLCDH